jgi:hypothetical protein
MQPGDGRRLDGEENHGHSCSATLTRESVAVYGNGGSEAVSAGGVRNGTGGHSAWQGQRRIGPDCEWDATGMMLPQDNFIVNTAD